MKNKAQTKKLVGMASLTAMVVVLQIISNYVTIAGISMTLSLIPIAVGAILYGPTAGLFLGLVMGGLVLIAPATITTFFSVNAFATIVICLLKGGMAGLASGLAFKWLKKYNFVAATVTAAILTPIVNTTIFLIGAPIFFKSAYGADTFASCFVIIWGLVWLQVIIEVGINSFMSPALCQLVRVLGRSYDLGFSIDLDDIDSNNDDSIENTEENNEVTE